MKKLLTLLFAVALTLSLSSVTFAQDASSAPADSKDQKKAEKKEKKSKKKADKKEKKDEMKADAPK